MRLLIVCGGTGGHIFPAISLADELKKRDTNCETVFIVDDKEKTIRLIQEAGYNCLPLKVPKMPYGVSFAWPGFIIELFMARMKAEVAVCSINPDIAVGLGAYISWPVISVCRSMRIKTIIHEQNAEFGRANRMLINKADRVCVSFPESANRDIKKKYIVTGNPIRKELLSDFKTMTKNKALEQLGLNPGIKTILVVGGSGGASYINETMLKFAEGLDGADRHRIQIIHLSGDKDFEGVDSGYRKNKIIHWVRPFYERMGLLYKAADMAVCRAGATTIAELCLFGLPALFIPYPGAGSHQRLNASIFEKAGGALILKQEGMTESNLKNRIYEILDNNSLRKMGDIMRSYSVSDAAAKLADVVEGLALC